MENVTRALLRRDRGSVEGFRWVGNVNVLSTKEHSLDRPFAEMESCCTCATRLPVPSGQGDLSCEKPPAPERRLGCCGRVICGRCTQVRPISHNAQTTHVFQRLCWLHQGYRHMLIHADKQSNPRFEKYCPYCQISTAPSYLPPGGLKEPPSYNAAVGPVEDDAAPPPPYSHDSAPSRPQRPLSAARSSSPTDEKAALSASAGNRGEQPTAPDTLHFLDHERDTIPSLSLRYNVPASVLRRANHLASDHLLAARRTLIIPGSHYQEGVSLSPRPVEGEEEETRKGKIRRWMVACKVPDYDVALFYLQQADYDLDGAVQKYLDDERWEREHPLEPISQTRGMGKGKGKAPGPGQARSIGDWSWAKRAAG
jgi:hypothetical protein